MRGAPVGATSGRVIFRNFFHSRLNKIGERCTCRRARGPAAGAAPRPTCPAAPGSRRAPLPPGRTAAAAAAGCAARRHLRARRVLRTTAEVSTVGSPNSIPPVRKAVRVHDAEVHGSRLFRLPLPMPDEDHPVASTPARCWTAMVTTQQLAAARSPFRPLSHCARWQRELPLQVDVERTYSAWANVGPELGRGEGAAGVPVSSESASVTTASRLDWAGAQCASEGNVSRPAASTQGCRIGCVTDNPGRLCNMR